MTEIVYHEVRIARSARPRRVPEDYLAPPGPAISFSEPTREPFADTALFSRVRDELWVNRDRIAQAMPVVGGVLLRVSYHEARVHEGKGPVPQELVALDVVGSGRVPNLVVSDALSSTGPARRAPRGWVGRTVYLWAARS